VHTVKLLRLTVGGLVIGSLTLMSACVVHTTDRAGYNQGYKEGYYDREHHRYWHERGWRECGEHDEHCRD
jgi:hypothetical protein